jgi:DhnA family fructose-bisphosphate aldolase class Ia
MQKSLDTKLAALREDKSNKDFIICYAADPDLAAGILAMVDLFPSLNAYRDHMDALVRDAKLDILLTSASTMDELGHRRKLFDESPVTPAVRANDTTDNWHVRHGNYATSLSRPNSSSTLNEIRYGEASPAADAEMTVNLGLYSVTFNNDPETDLKTLQKFREFRLAANEAGFRYFVEIFNPSAPQGLDASQVPDFVNDCIARMLAGMPDSSAPEFLKLTYNGPKAMEDLVNYTPSIVGVLGGSPSTSLDAFTLLHKAKQHGARVALFGRRIQVTEDPVSFVRILREVADDNLGPDEAVKAYHGALQELGVKPQRSLEDDMVIVTPELKL